MSASLDDPYLYPGTQTLKNLANIRDPEKLAQFEAQATLRRVLEMRQRPIEGAFDTAHFKTIHRHLFQDVYEWAGQFRTTMLGKAQHLGGPVVYFTPPHLLEHEAERIFARLHRANVLQGLSRGEFAKKAAQLLRALNKLHPYREGNGRTQRAFVEAVARQAGHALYFDVISKERMVQASILANEGGIGMMTRIFEEITGAERVKPLRRAIEFLESNGFNWNNTYLATSTPGRSYAGKLVGRDQDAFMMRTADQIIIGRQADIPPQVRSGEELSFTAAMPPEIPESPAARSRATVARNAAEQMRSSRTAIQDIPITERAATRSGSVTGTVMAQNEMHLAVATAPNSFVVLERAAISGDVEVGMRVHIRFSRGCGTLEQSRDHGR